MEKKGKYQFNIQILYGIVYSPNKYRETEGIKDIGSNFWNDGRTDEIAHRYVHVDNHELK